MLLRHARIPIPPFALTSKASPIADFELRTAVFVDGVLYRTP